MKAPFVAVKLVVPSEWIDINGHMNATHYGLVVYQAQVRLTEEIGMGEDYVKSTSCGKAVLESHLIYEREVGEGDELEVRSWLLAVDTKRLHYFHELYNLTRNCRAAAAEQVDVHMDLVKRASTPIPEWLLNQLKRRVEANLALPLPAKIGSRIRPPVNSWLQQV